MPGPPALGPTALACPAPRPALLAARVAIIGWSPPTRSPPGSSHGSHVGLTHMPAPQKAGHSSRSATPCILNHTELYLNSPGHVLFCFVFLSVSPPEQSLQHPQRWHRGGVQKLGVKPLLLQLWLLAGAAQQPSQTPVTGEWPMPPSLPTPGQTACAGHVWVRKKQRLLHTQIRLEAVGRVCPLSRHCF